MENNSGVYCNIVDLSTKQVAEYGVGENASYEEWLRRRGFVPLPELSVPVPEAPKGWINRLEKREAWLCACDRQVAKADKSEIVVRFPRSTRKDEEFRTYSQACGRLDELGYSLATVWTARNSEEVWIKRGVGEPRSRAVLFWKMHERA